MTTDEMKFYDRLKRSMNKLDLLVHRMENEADPGWPDVILRADGGLHLWVELKIAKGRNARIEVRPSQINWMEAHIAKGGVVYLLAQNEMELSQMWVIPGNEVPTASQNGCLGYPCYDRPYWGRVIEEWTHRHGNVQRQGSPSVQPRSQLEHYSGKTAQEGTVLQIVRRSRLRDAGESRGSHYSAQQGGIQSRVESTIPVQRLPRRKKRQGEAWWN